MHDLIEYLKTHVDGQAVKEVWVNDKGEWLFSEREGFTRFTREEIISQAEKPTKKSK